MNVISVYIGTAKIVTKTAVKARLATMGITKYYPGSIFVESKEADFTGTNLLYCRYGLAVPFQKVSAGQNVLIQPTIRGKERWFFVGFADCGGYEPVDADILVAGDFDGDKYIRIQNTKMTLKSPIHEITDGSTTIKGLTHVHPTAMGPSGPPTAGS